MPHALAAARMASRPRCRTCHWQAAPPKVPSTAPSAMATTPSTPSSPRRARQQERVARRVRRRRLHHDALHGGLCRHRRQHHDRGACGTACGSAGGSATGGSGSACGCDWPAVARRLAGCRSAPLLLSNQHLLGRFVLTERQHGRGRGVWGRARHWHGGRVWCKTVFFSTVAPSAAQKRPLRGPPCGARSSIGWCLR